MPIGLVTPSLPLRVDADGAVRVGGTRVTLDTIVAVFNDGQSAEEIAQEFPSVNLADVYTTIGYYLQNRTAVDAYLAERHADATALRQRCEAKWDPRGLRERLLKRRRSDAS